MSLSPAKPVPVFDGHNDLLYRLFISEAEDPVSVFLQGNGEGHLDLPRCRQGGFAGGMFAIFVPSTVFTDPAELTKDKSARLPPTPELPAAQQATIKMAALLLRIEERAPEDFKVCRSAADIETAMQSGKIAAVMHVEGLEAVGPDLFMLDVLHAAGLRSLGPVWSRPNIFGHGVPFRFNSTPDTGEGLTEVGKALIRRCNQLKILIDLSHLNERGFWDVAALSDAPLVATHSNVHALCPHARNLTPRQLAAIRESRGMVGVNFATAFLRDDGRTEPETPLEDIVRHLAALIEALGEDHVGLGSDFDGAAIPRPLRDAAGLPALLEACSNAGFGAALIEKIAHRNWLNLLRRTWGEAA
ncbi:dipeptidase AC. Metallo peptidase. MEROPS family M19 [Arboricoccus pini]|uniref:Dipeptidase AC. Metallo peptidase. MEROPS family M19 n=1 Tax=Arboricoccus pini TaxID=1963835 RepID=A0A212PXS1_9PROT|nr:dipeptidase AC. Metallo peptidase. MEROPS family M19 [Arboricoccus pini]